MSSPLPTWAFRPSHSGFSPPPGEAAPVIVAESLETVRLPLATTLRPSVAGRPSEVVGQIASGLGRPLDPRPLPEWLRPEQRASCAQLLPILERYHCALLADPVGSGKTWMALAVAAVWNSGVPAIVIVPSTIASQWQGTAARLGIAIELWSHERLSRGALPPSLKATGASLVIIDESHHFRNPATRRYGCLAPSLRGRTVLLLSATPVVNKLGDLQSQLALGTRDDALAPFGIPSLGAHLAGNARAASILGELIIASEASPDGAPRRHDRKERPAGVDQELESVCQAIETLTLSVQPATAALIRTVLWRALASSSMALLAALRRYHALLSHARDAAKTGHVPSRAMLRSFVGEDDQQLVMWEMFEAGLSSHDIALADLPGVERLIEKAKESSRRPDGRCRSLAALLSDRKPTLVFTVARETVRYLREQLPAVAWCTGDEAGIGFTRMPRDAVLSWFRPGAELRGGPHVLITTDVSSEGLDLQHAARVVHYDLPWTAVRLDQRNGRALRLGSVHDRVEVIRFQVPAALEHRLGQLGTVAKKRKLPRQAGIEGKGSRFWSWRQAMARQFGTGTPSNPGQYCRVGSDEPGILAGFSLYAYDGQKRRGRLATHVGHIGSGGMWNDDPSVVEHWLEKAVTAERIADEPMEDDCLSTVAAIIRGQLDSVQQARWCHHHTPLQTRLIRRLNQLAAKSVRARNSRQLRELERAIAFVGGGHTAGERMWLEQLAAQSDHSLLIALSRCSPPEPGMPVMYVELLGIVIFDAGS